MQDKFRVVFDQGGVKISPRDCTIFLTLPDRPAHGAIPWGNNSLIKGEKKHSYEVNSKCGLVGCIWEKGPESDCSRESGVVPQISNEVMKKKNDLHTMVNDPSS